MELGCICAGSLNVCYDSFLVIFVGFLTMEFGGVIDSFACFWNPIPSTKLFHSALI